MSHEILPAEMIEFARLLRDPGWGLFRLSPSDKVCILNITTRHGCLIEDDGTHARVVAWLLKHGKVVRPFSEYLAAAKE